MFRYILFDLDGTLTDPKIGITTCVQYALKSFGIEEENLDKLEPFIGPPLTDSFERFYGFSKEDAKKAVEKYRERFSTIGLYENEIYPGVREMLDSLSGKGIRLAVASSKPTVFVEKILVHFKIREYFSVVVGSELDGRRSKKEEVVSEALRQLGVTEQEKSLCAMVGDRDFDVFGAKQQGVVPVAVSYGYAQGNELEKAGASFIAKDVWSLSQYLMNGEKKRYSFYEPFAIRVKEVPQPEKTSFLRAFSVIAPILIYYVVNNLTIFLFAYFVGWLAGKQGILLELSVWLSGHSTLVSALMKFVAMMLGAGILIPAFLQENPVIFPEKNCQKDIPVIICLGISAAVFANVLFFLLQITGSSESFSKVSSSQFSLPVWGGIVLYGLVSPFAEELVFRGVVYNRFRRQYPFVIAFLASAFLFGIFHGNLVQALYGFLLGLLILWLYEKYGAFLIPFLVHSSANIIIYVLMGTKSLQNVIMTIPFCMLSGLVTVALIVYILRKRKENSY